MEILSFPVRNHPATSETIKRSVTNLPPSVVRKVKDALMQLLEQESFEDGSDRYEIHMIETSLIDGSVEAKIAFNRTSSVHKITGT